MGTEAPCGIPAVTRSRIHKVRAALTRQKRAVIIRFTVRGERGVSDEEPIVDDRAPLYHVWNDAPPILLGS